MNTFTFVRNEDITGISGTGAVAQGVEFDDGTVVVRWFELNEDSPNYKRGVRATTVVFPNITAVMALHGHMGATQLIWDESSYPAPWQTWTFEGGPQGKAMCEALGLDSKTVLEQELHVLPGIRNVSINYTGCVQVTKEQWENARAILEPELNLID